MEGDPKAEKPAPSMVAGSGQTAKPTPASKIKGKTVRMIIPKRVLINDNYQMVEFLPGVQDVPEKYADHWYLKAHGATLADTPGEEEQTDEEKLEEELDEQEEEDQEAADEEKDEKAINKKKKKRS